MSDMELQGLDQFQDAINSYQEATQKDMVDVLNRAGRNVAYRAAQFTDVASAAKIRAELYRDPHLVYALTSLSLRKQGIGTLPKGAFQQEVEKFISRRQSSTRYLRSGWAQAIIDLGGTFRGSRLTRGTHGYGSKATLIELLAEIAWIIDEPNDHKADSAEEVGMKALQKALDFVTQDMQQYAEEKMAKTAKDHSA